VYAIRVAERDKVQGALGAAGIATGIHYPIPVHLQKGYADLGYGPGDLPVTEALAREFLSLPIYSELEPDQVVEVASQVDRACLEWPARSRGRLAAALPA
jgi:dTDP-4-amino-4,6-dideoxygalactose transaminase